MQYKARLAALRTAIDEGNASGVAKSNVFCAPVTAPLAIACPTVGASALPPAIIA